MSTGTLDIDKYVCTGTKSENPFAIHSNHCCSLQEARLCPSRQFWYVPVKDGYTVLCLSTNTARKKCKSGESESERFLPWAGWTRTKCCIAPTKRQCLPSAWICPVLHHFRQEESANIQDCSHHLFLSSSPMCTAQLHHLKRLVIQKSGKTAPIYQLTFKRLIFIHDISTALIKLNKCQVFSDISCSLKWTLWSHALLKISLAALSFC